MSSINRNTAREIGEAMEKALAPVAEQFGLTVKVGGGTFDPTIGTFKPKVEFKSADSDKALFAECCASFLLDPDDFGREFQSGGRTFKISGIAPKSWKRPILAVDQKDGRTYKFPADERLLKALGKVAV